MNYHGKMKRAKKICRPFRLPGITHLLPQNSSWPNHRLKVRQKIWTRKEAKIGVLRHFYNIFTVGSFGWAVQKRKKGGPTQEP